ncbi:pleiotropic drug resistance protein 3-like, partial [Fagus crenata]
MTVFLRTRMDIDVLHENYCMGSLFYALVILLVDFILLFAVHLSSLSMFRFLASVFQTNTSSMTAASMPVWLKWGFWVCPLTYGEIGLSLNEFLAPRWRK